jgi:hypothetical protein
LLLPLLLLGNLARRGITILLGALGRTTLGADDWVGAVEPAGAVVGIDGAVPASEAAEGLAALYRATPTLT